ncbi:uncharacterized protein LOC110837291 [Zootermopsis nevadensis]|uniref:Uncharacterized protein n=1 Tax=Zootermopsis nevadensis TaxID=136037 RepID=A0A067QR85_ZOONE|nr:uncharacterized protein LOC110837291 [Zootermopsis nevadensis]KDR11178.1 hypothetical protein L798_14686 [Zootermopsis nevadensis]
MKILVALVVALVVASVGAQHLAWPYGTAILPAGAVSPMMTVKEPSTVVVKSVVDNPVQMKGLFGVPVSSIYQYPHVVQVAIPSQDTTRGMPQPVEDTPEVKSAKALFAKEYERAAIAAALAPEVRRRRDISSVMLKETPASTTHLRSPMQYPWPLITYSADHSWLSGLHVPSHFAHTSGVYGASPAPVISY